MQEKQENAIQLQPATLEAYIPGTAADKPKDYLTPLEFAQILGINKRTVCGWIKQGKLPGVKIGGLYFIRRDEIEKQIKAGETANKKQRTAKGGGR